VGVAGAVVERQPTTHVVAQQEHDQQRAQHVSQDPATDMGARASGDKATSDGEYPDLAAALSRVRALAAALPPPFQPLSGAVRILNRCWCVSVCVCVCATAHRSIQAQASWRSVRVPVLPNGRQTPLRVAGAYLVITSKSFERARARLGLVGG